MTIHHFAFVPLNYTTYRRPINPQQTRSTCKSYSYSIGTTRDQHIPILIEGVIKGHFAKKKEGERKARPLFEFRYPLNEPKNNTGKVGTQMKLYKEKKGKNNKKYKSLP